MRVAMGSDHAGFELKETLKASLIEEHYEILDVGTHATDPVDYPDYAEAVGTTLRESRADRGIIVCGSGVGASMAANRVHGVRAGLCHDTYSAHQGVEHDDMNVLVLGGRVVGIELARELTRAFLNARFTGEPRHRRRLAKMTSLENPLRALQVFGQSVWLDYIRRSLITSGELRRMIDEDGLRGVTSNPAIFEKAVTGSSDYKSFLEAPDARSLDAKALYEQLAVRDIQEAADALRPVYEVTSTRDGYVSLEVSPSLAYDTAGTLDEARRLWRAVGRDNLMIKIPATPQGVPAVQQLIGEGINVNVTLLFAQEVYEQVAEAYIAGLERLAANGGDVKRVASVASFFISRIDTALDTLTSARLQATKEAANQSVLRGLTGKVAIANAKLTYQRYLELFSGPRWQDLADRGAQTQRLLWASTGTKNPNYRDVLYVEELVGPDTVNTIPPATLDAFRDHGRPRASLVEDGESAFDTMAGLAEAGISMKAMTDKLLAEGVQLFSNAFEKLLTAVDTQSRQSGAGRINRLSYSVPEPLAAAVNASLMEWQADGKVRRLWGRDPSIWSGKGEDQWLGWLGITNGQLAHLQRLTDVTAAARSAGFAHVLLLGMGGSSLGPEVMKMTFGKIDGFPELHVLDSTDPAQVRACENKVDLKNTLVIVSSKSGSTLEPNIFKQYFFDRVQRLVGAKEAGSRFIAITDPGSKTQQVAERDGFRRVFFGWPNIGGRYSVLSDFGLVPAAIMGVDVAKFLDRAEEMVCACMPSVPIEENPGVLLGTILGVAASQFGRDKMTIVSSPGIHDLGAWLEQLVAESTGKDGRGLIPIDRETLGAPDIYGRDRIFVYLRLQPAPDAAQDRSVEALERAGHPVVRIALDDPYDLGEEFFRWEFATAVAGSILGINPFDQPDVEASKIATRKLTDAYEKYGALPAETPIFTGEGITLFTDEKNAAVLANRLNGNHTLAGYLEAHLSRLRPGDYFALLAYIEMNEAHERALQAMRHGVRDARHIATCLEFGPRFLHSTGQAYKGGPNTGVFLQITCDDAFDLVVPGQKYTFGVVKAAQARGDFEVLVERNRRALRAHLGADVAAHLRTLQAAFRAALGHERKPRNTSLHYGGFAMGRSSMKSAAQPKPRPAEGRRRGAEAGVSPPNVCLLSNGRYNVMLTQAGSGYSSCGEVDVTRWREDATGDCWGQYCYIRDVDGGSIWSAGRQPLGGDADDYEAILGSDRAVFRRRDADIETRYEVAVATDANAEVRRITLTNHGVQPRTLEVTSYAEIALNDRRADQAHPAFAKLFLQTEYLPTPPTLVYRRRPRARDQKPIWALHVLAGPEDAPRTTVGAVEYETDRARFLGRGRTAARPAALDSGVVLSGTVGPVLDPILSLRRQIRLDPGASSVLAFITAAAVDRDDAVALAHRFSDLAEVESAFEQARIHDLVTLAALGITREDAARFHRLSAHVLFTAPALRSRQSVTQNRLGQSGLWPHAISGDLPIVLARLAGPDEIGLAGELLRAHSYWRRCGLVADLVLLNDAGPPDELQRALEELIRLGPAADLAGKPGGVFLKIAVGMPPADVMLLEAAARAILHGDEGVLAAQLERAPIPAPLPADVPVSRATATTTVGKPTAVAEALSFSNGLGGFTADGREYVLTLRGSERPPTPWSNVIANPGFGCLITESGAGYTWAGNAQQNRLTPWSNDPVSDPPGEVLYLRDEETGDFWTPASGPCGGEATIVVRHGQGYTRFSRTSHGLEQDLLVLVSPSDPLKLFRLRVVNHGDRPRRLSATFYAEWVLGVHRDQAPLQVVCTLDQESGALFARNAWANDFAGRVAFADVGRRPRSFTMDRTEFLGRNGTPEAPAALRRASLADRAGELCDPCAALMTGLELQPGGEDEVVFMLGQAASEEEAQRLVRSYAEAGRAQRVLEQVKAKWDLILGAVQVRTPDPALDLMLNRWLIYQTLACRVWGRSGFYQSGGAFGFRDQLQDAMALVYGAEKQARAQILRAAAHQFEEGDVQHWWHPPSGRGVRTRITDDLYFLPFVTCHYVATTGDAALLDERVPFLRAPVLNPDQEEDYGLPEVSDVTGTVYEHCVRALEHGLKLGPHGLPLMGTGDWNDGMNKVGADGRGESVWNGWFMLATLREFADLAEQRGDAARAAWCRERAEALRRALEEHAWDGSWYRRAYFDDGTPLGSAQNDECQIDSIAQSWAVISGAGDPERARLAMAAVEDRLVSDPEQMILLFAPPFDRGSLEPGYIKGYVPGIRENGGQYTHAATWVVLATALQGRGKRALELFALLNPISHTATNEAVERYKVEPYVIAADVYGAPPHTGRGGWTWYTGSAGWLYRVGLEAILGFRLRGDRLRIEPCVAPDWPRYELTYHHRSATYHIVVENAAGRGRGVRAVTVDATDVPDGEITLMDDGKAHAVRVELG